MSRARRRLILFAIAKVVGPNRLRLRTLRMPIRFHMSCLLGVSEGRNLGQDAFIVLTRLLTLLRYGVLVTLA